MSDMMNFLKARYQERPRTRIEIPEIEGPHGGPMIWYARPFTIADSEALRHCVDRDTDDGFIETIIRKAEDENGDLLFEKSDKPLLRRMLEAKIIKRVAADIIESAVPSEDAEKN